MLAPDTLLKLPGQHGEAMVALLEFTYHPGVATKQLVLPCGENVPGPQLTQPPAGVMPVPGAQVAFVQFVHPTPELKFAAHAVQLDAPSVAE